MNKALVDIDEIAVQYKVSAATVRRIAKSNVQSEVKK